MWFDTHMHLDPEADVAGIVTRAGAAGVGAMLAVGGNAELNAAALDAADRCPDTLCAAIGYDRQVAESAGATLDAAKLMRHLAQTKSRELGEIRAIGETGLDYYHQPETAAAQRVLFQAHLDLAADLQLPVIVHNRQADDDIVRLLTAHARRWQGPPEHLGVIHCFTGHPRLAETLAGLGFYISFSGIITFRNAATLRAAAAVVPEARLLVETDSPYLAPVPHRGEVNEPAYLPHVGHAVAAARDADARHIEVVTTRNARRLFVWDEVDKTDDAPPADASGTA